MYATKLLITQPKVYVSTTYSIEFFFTSGYQTE